MEGFAVGGVDGWEGGEGWGGGGDDAEVASVIYGKQGKARRRGGGTLRLWV